MSILDTLFVAVWSTGLPAPDPPAVGGARSPEDAVAHYFKVVGDRWDHERLVVTTAAGNE